MTIDNINSAAATALANSKNANKTVEEYLKDLQNIRLSDSKLATSEDNVIISMLSLIAIHV
jgi:uncharacterized tellurite resistance protein B-like protein